MRPLTAALLGASMIVAAPALAQEAPAAPAPAAPAAAPAPWGYAPYPYAAPPAPYWWRSPPGDAVTERRSNGMRIAGITLFALGGVVNAIGGGIFALGLTTTCYATVDAGGFPPPRHRARERVGTSRQALGQCGDDTTTVGAGVMAAGLLGSLAGIPLFVLGNARVRARPEGAAAPAPELRVGLGGADLRWQF